MPAAGYLIFQGIMPLIKTYITIIAGFVAARMGLFPKTAARGASQVTMNIALPALIFANVVPAFTSSNVWALGPLFLLAFIYQIIGFIAGLIIREVCYVPRNFWQGLVVMTGMSNWGNLPNAVVMTITQQPPFDPAIDQALGVSYVSIFIVAYHTVFWVFGAAHSLSWDYRPGIPQGEAAERRVSWKEKPLGSLITRYILHQDIPSSFAEPPITYKDEESIAEKDDACKSADVQVPVQELASESPLASTVAEGAVREIDPDVQLARKTSRLSTTTAPTHRRSSFVAPVVPPVPPPSPVQSARDIDTQSIAQRSATLNTPTFSQKIVRVFHPLSALMTPVTIALVISLPIALIQPLKALFVDVSAVGGPNFKGPDNRPPLAFITDTAQFMGAINVPLALVLLGANFARLTVPRPLSRLPIMAMLLSTFAKMVMLPIIGVLLVAAMTRSGFVHKDEKVLRFVMMFLSGTPTAVNQLIVASLYAPGGNVDTLSACLLVQYTFMFISSSTLTAVALLVL